MIEILVAMAILVILIGIVAVTFTGITRGAKQRETKVRMESLKAMLSELEALGGLKSQPSVMWVGGSPPSQYNYDKTATAESPIDIWRDGDPSSHAPDEPLLPAPAPGNVSLDIFQAGTTATRDRSAHSTILNTQIAMGLMLKAPNNASALERLPKNAIMEAPGKDPSIPAGSHGLFTHQAAGNRKSPLRPAILVDAWNNPIILVPAAGLRGIALKAGGTDQVITSAGVFPYSTNYRTPANARPFFASAGPDGDFTTGDDNVYSFEE